MGENDEWVFGSTEVVSKKLYNEAIERAIKAEVQLAILQKSWRVLELYLGATQLKEDGLIRETSNSEVPG